MKTISETIGAFLLKINGFWLFLLFFGFLMLEGCKAVKGPDKTADKEAYSEDLSKHRPRPEVKELEKFTSSEEKVEVNIQDDVRLKEQDLSASFVHLFALHKESQKDNRSVQGFTIQVYSGSNRDLANQHKERIYERFGDNEMNVQTRYVQPNFKIQVGKFYDRLSAQKVYVKLKREFPSAIVVPEKFNIK